VTADIERWCTCVRLVNNGDLISRFADPDCAVVHTDAPPPGQLTSVELGHLLAEARMQRTLTREDSWFQTYTNRAFYLVDPDPALIDLADIAHSLAYQCRFNGHTEAFYSVAQHSVLVAEYLLEKAPEHALWGLLHDAAEAYVGDVIRPLKRRLPGFVRIEGPIEAAIAKRFGLCWPMPVEIKEADVAVLLGERRDLRPPLPREPFEKGEPWPPLNLSGFARPGAEPSLGRIVPLPPEAAEAEFIWMFRLLTEGWGGGPPSNMVTQ
jgi:hypothetical protein